MNFYKFAKTITNRFFRIFFRVKVIGSENEPTEGPFLVCSNHLSNNDVLLLGTSFHHQVRFFAKKELFAVPILKQLITSLGAFPVDRQNAAASFSSIKNAVSLLKGGEVVGIFPQGKRLSGMDPRKTNIKSGVGMIEYHAKVPVVPVLLETSNWKILPFRRTYVRIGKPISYEEFNFTESSGKQFSEASQLIFKRITEQIGGNG